MLAERLKKEIADANITMYRLAKDLKLSKQTVLNWCNGETEPKAAQIVALCKYFEVSADYLLGLKDNM